MLYSIIRIFLTFLLRYIMPIFLVAALPGCERSPAFHATDITGASFGRLAALDGLTRHDGRRLATADFSGKAVVVFFGYTQCPDICPTTLSAMQEAIALLGPDADRVQVLFVTIDPERDTREMLAGYVPWFDSRFIGLVADPDATRRIAGEFRVFYARVKGETALAYSIDHSATSYVYDPAGRLRLLFRHATPPADITADLAALLAGK